MPWLDPRAEAIYGSFSARERNELSDPVAVPVTPAPLTAWPPSVTPVLLTAHC